MTVRPKVFNLISPYIEFWSEDLIKSQTTGTIVDATTLSFFSSHLSILLPLPFPYPQTLFLIPPSPILIFSLPSFSYLFPVYFPSPIWVLCLLFPFSSIVRHGGTLPFVIVELIVAAKKGCDAAKNTQAVKLLERWFRWLVKAIMQQ